LLECPLCDYSASMDHDMFHHIEEEHTENGAVIVTVRIGQPSEYCSWFRRFISGPIRDIEFISIREEKGELRS